MFVCPIEGPVLKDVLMDAKRSDPWWAPHRSHESEWIDSFDQPPEDLRRCFLDIQRINRLFGGTNVIVRHMGALVGQSREPHSVLDVCTGSADIPRFLIESTRKRGTSLSIVCLDASDRVLKIARDENRREASLQFINADALALPFQDGSFDFVLSSLAMHHFDDSSAGRILLEMNRVARRALVVNDLRRGYLPAGLIWLITRLLRMNRLTRHDASLSVLRSRTMREYEELVRKTGFVDAKVFKHPFWRAAIVVRKAA